MPAPDAPEDLREPGARLWGEITAEFELDERELALLGMACGQADDLAALESVVGDDGFTVVGSQGQPRLHPALLRSDRHESLSRVSSVSSPCLTRPGGDDLTRSQRPDGGPGALESTDRGRVMAVRRSRAFDSVPTREEIAELDYGGLVAAMAAGDLHEEAIHVPGTLDSFNWGYEFHRLVISRLEELAVKDRTVVERLTAAYAPRPTGQFIAGDLQWAEYGMAGHAEFSAMHLTDTGVKRWGPFAHLNRNDRIETRT